MRDDKTPLVKGALLESRYISGTRFAVPGGVEALNQALLPATREAVIHNNIASEWYPLALLEDLIEKMSTHAFAGDNALMRKAGYFAAQRTYKGVWRAFIKLLSPVSVVRRSPTMWKMAYQNNGRLEVPPLEDTASSAEIHLRDMTFRSAAHYELYIGVMNGILELTRTKAEVEIVHGGGTADFAVYQCRWQRL